MDSAALSNKAGTKQADSGANLNASWATYYQAAMEEAPAMCFCLSEAWCRSKWCERDPGLSSRVLHTTDDHVDTMS